jgi:hypothetical protein
VEEPQELLDGVMEVEEEPTPEETEVVAEVREVPDRPTDEETGNIYIYIYSYSVTSFSSLFYPTRGSCN